jgi:hypothetical protein
MKKLILFLGFLAFIPIVKAQITLENNYPASATVTELALSGYKYYLMDVTNNQCRLFNMDHSIWKTINLEVPSGMYLYDIRGVSETLFNIDSKVELAYIYYSYDTTLLYYTYYTKIVNEDGVDVLSIPGCAYIDFKTSGSNGTKLLAYVYDYSIIMWTVNTLIYSLPGNLPTGEIYLETENNHTLAYPNPAHSILTIPYHLPIGTESGQLQILNTSGQIQKTLRLSPNFHELLIPMNDLSGGGYIYQVKTSRGVVSSGSFIHD